MKHRLVNFRFLFCIFLITCIPDQEMKFTSNQKSCIAQSASPSDVQGLAWSSTGGADIDWEPFWPRVTSLLRWGTFSQGWRILNTWWKGKVYGVGSQPHYPDFSWSIAGKERVTSLVRAFEYTNFKPVAVHTLFCWQRVFLLSVSLLQFRLVKGCDLCNVWFVTHVCRRSSKESPQLELQEVMRTWEEVTARVGEVTTFAGWVRLIYFLHLKVKQQARLPPFLKCVRM